MALSDESKKNLTNGAAGVAVGGIVGGLTGGAGSPHAVRGAMGAGSQIGQAATAAIKNGAGVSGAAVAGGLAAKGVIVATATAAAPVVIPLAAASAVGYGLYRIFKK